MFVVSIGDGLGNQMFQFAFFYSLKKHYTNCGVYFDDFFYGSVNKHNGIELEKIFPIKLVFCTKKTALSLCDYHAGLKKEHFFLSLIWKIRQILFGGKQSFIMQDDATCFYPEIYSLNPLYSYYFRGNWVNPKYFDKYRSDILKMFSFPEIIEHDNLLIKKEISKDLSVSVHVRAGDYLKDSSYNLANDYYYSAINYLCSKLNKEIKDFHFFIFSDDLEFADNLLSYLTNKTLVSCNRKNNSYRDMQLMSLCKHNIIANSTFSFWGAYLNINKSKIVIAPKKAHKNMNNPFACDDWVTL